MEKGISGSVLPIELKISPADHPKLDEWKSQLLWKLTTIDVINEFIKEVQQEKIKSGVLYFRDLETNAFQAITFRSKFITQPSGSDVLVKLRKAKAPTRQLTFEEKCDMLEQFIKDNGRTPDLEDLYENFKVGRFYASLIKSRNKFQDILIQCGAENVQNEEVEEEDQ